MIIEDNIYQCELCPTTNKVKGVGWATLTTKSGVDDHLCPECWVPDVKGEYEYVEAPARVYPKSGKDRLALLMEENRHI